METPARPALPSPSSRPARRRGLVLTAAVLAAAAALPACAKDEPGTTTGTSAGPAASTKPPTSGSVTTGGGTTTKPTTSGSTTPGSTVDGIDPMDDATLDDKSGTTEDATVALLTDVRVARHEGYDRVVFEFTDHTPAWEVGYKTKPIMSDGAGEEVPLDGAHALVIRMPAASGVDMEKPSGTLGYTQVYKGSKRIDAGTPEITEVVQTGDFEAQLTWAIGTQDKVDFRVQVLESPARLVIDVRNH